MAKLKLFLQICLLTWLLQLTNGTETSPNSTALPEATPNSIPLPETTLNSTPLPETSSNLTLWPDLSCHVGYIKDSQPGKENGEISLFQQMQSCADEIKEMFDKSAECMKRCMLEKIGVLSWRVFEFRLEMAIERSLIHQLFPNHPHTGRQIAKQLLESDCQPMRMLLKICVHFHYGIFPSNGRRFRCGNILVATLAKAETKPSCEDQNQFFDCVEKAMQCK